MSGILTTVDTPNLMKKLSKLDEEIISLCRKLHSIRFYILVIYEAWTCQNPGCVCVGHRHVPDTYRTCFDRVQHESSCLTRRTRSNEFRTWALHEFLDPLGAFADPNSLRDRGFVDPKCWWVLYGSSTLNLQALSLKLLGQPYFSSCCERNWSTYSFIYSFKRNKLIPAWEEDLVNVHNCHRLFSRNSEEYNEVETKMWDIAAMTLTHFRVSVF